MFLSRFRTWIIHLRNCGFQNDLCFIVLFVIIQFWFLTIPFCACFFGWMSYSDSKKLKRKNRSSFFKKMEEMIWKLHCKVNSIFFSWFFVVRLVVLCVFIVLKSVLPPPSQRVLIHCRGAEDRWARVVTTLLRHTPPFPPDLLPAYPPHSCHKSFSFLGDPCARAFSCSISD